MAEASESLLTAPRDPELDQIFTDGHDLNIFLELEPHFLNRVRCGSCTKISRDPQQRICGHIFCRVCRERLTAKAINNPEPVYCPACVSVNDIIDESRVKPYEPPAYDFAVVRMLTRKEVRCPSEGCSWQGHLKDYCLRHEIECPYAQTPCPYKCGESVHVAMLAKHLEKDCGMRVVRCAYCNEEYPAMNEEEHSDNCMSRPAMCDLCKRNDLNREQLMKHRESECKMFKCPISCAEPMERDQVYEHFSNVENSKKHMLAIADKFEVLKNDIRRMSALIHQAKHSHQSDMPPVDNERVQELIENVMQMEDQVRTLDNMSSVFKVEFEKLFESAIHNKQRCDHIMGVQNDMQERLQRLEQAVQIRDVQLMERDLRLKALEDISYDGTLIWRVENFRECQRKARDGEMTSIYSPAFYTSRCGYKLCARLYLNGDGIGKGTHISFFFVVMRGKYDGLLRWPFQQKVTMMLLDYTSQHHIMDAFRPDSGSASFHRPKNEMNVASGCPLFMPLSALQEKISNHVRDDIAYFKIIVDCSDIPY